MTPTLKRQFLFLLRNITNPCEELNEVFFVSVVHEHIDDDADEPAAFVGQTPGLVPCVQKHIGQWSEVDAYQSEIAKGTKMISFPENIMSQTNLGESN